MSRELHPLTLRPRGRRSIRGVTLIELMIAIAITTIVMMFALVFATQSMRLQAQSNQTLELTAALRLTADVLQRDLVNAGSGVGYAENGFFRGVFLGVEDGSSADFVLDGGATFFPQGVDITTDSGTIRTYDIVLRMAAGESVSVVTQEGGAFETCATDQFKEGDLVVVRSADGISSRVVVVSDFNDPADCTVADACVELGSNQCNVWTAKDPDAEYLPVNSGESGTEWEQYGQGASVIGDYRTVIWWVAPRNGRGELRRLVVDGNNPSDDCPGRGDPDCGVLVANDVETLQYALFEYDISSDPAVWAQILEGTELNGRNRLRLEFELLMRARAADDEFHLPIQVSMSIDPAKAACTRDPSDTTECLSACLPGGNGVFSGVCGGGRDRIRRVSYRAAAEIKNSGLVGFGGR